MPEERNIEKQLRACAEQRRREAGAPFEPHPVTRRLWQDEVRRVFGGKPAGAARRPFFSGLWLKLAIGGCAALLAAAFFLPALSKAKMKSQQLAKNVAQHQMEMPAEINAPAEATRADRSAGELETDTRKRALAEDKELAKAMPAKPPEPVAAPAFAARLELPKIEEARKPDAGKMAERGVLSGAGSLSAAAKAPQRAPTEVTVTSGLSENRLGDIPAAPAVVTAPVASLAPAATPVAMPQMTQNLYFRNAVVSVNGFVSQTDALAKDGVKLKAVIGAPGGQVAAQNVLMDSFRVEQSGDRIQIVDADGSVYNGILLADENGARAESVRRKLDQVQNAPASAATKTGTGAFALNGDNMYAGGTTISGGALQITTNALQQEQKFQFRASGTNLSLKQNVAISGEFVNVINVATNVLTTANNLTNQFQSAVRAVGGALQFSNGRVIGKAMTGDGHEIKINAEQVPPQ